MQFISIRRPRVNFMVLVTALLAVSGFITSCSREAEPVSNPAGPKGNEAADTNEAGVETQIPQLCVNEYYPIETASERSYIVTGEVPSSYTLKQEFAGDNGFKEHRRFSSGIKVVSNWTCTKDGLRNADYNNAITGANMKFSMETVQSSGVTLPKIWEKGKKWQTTYEIRVKFGKTTANGTVVIENELVSLDDKVSVKSGDYTAARIDSVIKINIRMGGNRVPAQDVKMSNWYAKEAGIVKQQSSTGFGQTGIEYAGEK